MPDDSLGRVPERIRAGWRPYVPVDHFRFADIHSASCTPDPRLETLAGKLMLRTTHVWASPPESVPAPCVSINVVDAMQRKR
jgi:hypothetical protein